MANKRIQLLKPEEDEKLFLAFTECKDGEMRTKIQAVRLYGNNAPVAEITNLTGLPRRTINRWYSRYLRLGLNGFVDTRRGVNNTYLTDEQIQDLGKRLNQYRPVDLLGLEKVATADGLFWSVPDLRQAVKQVRKTLYSIMNGVLHQEAHDDTNNDRSTNSQDARPALPTRIGNWF